MEGRLAGFDDALRAGVPEIEEEDDFPVEELGCGRERRRGQLFFGRRFRRGHREDVLLEFRQDLRLAVVGENEIVLGQIENGLSVPIRHIHLDEL